MGYYLDNQESFPEGIRRIGLELNNSAIDALAHDDEATHEGIHQARRCFKRIRSLFELVRDAVGKNTCAEGNDFYRGLARQLESLRDISALIGAVGILQSHFGELVRTETFEKVAALLEEEKAGIHQSMAGRSNDVESVIQSLQEGRERWLSLSVPDGCLDEVVRGLSRHYKGGYKLFHLAQGKPTVAEMHEWRKRVKHLWHMHEILLHAWPRVFRAYVKYWKELGDTLGSYHDLAMLQDKLGAYSEFLPEDSRRLLRAISQEQMNGLQRHSIKLGRRLFAEQADAFSQRMRHILQAWNIQGL